MNNDALAKKVAHADRMLGYRCPGAPRDLCKDAPYCRSVLYEVETERQRLMAEVEELRARLEASPSPR